MIQNSVETLDTLIANPKHNNLSYYSEGSHSRWCWCDALFMAPTSFARIGKITGEPKYFEFMDKEFRITYDSLYSVADSLFSEIPDTSICVSKMGRKYSGDEETVG